MAASTLSAQRNHFWVSPDGNDASDGSRDAPFATLERARDALRELPGHFAGGVVNIHGGVYRLNAPLELLPEDSGRGFGRVTYRAVKGETPHVYGSIPVSGWTLHDAALNIYVANVGPQQTRHFFVNGQRATRARTSDYPVSFVPHFQEDFKPDTSIDCAPGVPVTGGGGIEYIVDPLNDARWRDPHTWTNQDQIEAVMVTQWKSMRCPIERVTDNPGALDPASRIIEMQTPGWWNGNMFRDASSGTAGIWSFWNVNWFENAYEFLDEPGEWYLNQTTGDLYYIPRIGEDILTAEAELPVIEKLIDAKGSPDAPVQRIRFDGITFAYATWMGPSSSDGYIVDQSGFHVVGDGHETNIIGHVRHVVRTPGNLSFDYANSIEFINNAVLHMGGVGLDFGPGCQRNRITRNEFFDISSAAIQLGGVDNESARPSIRHGGTRMNTITDNH
ncbi:MAG: hypothetical protein ACQKBV_04710, partial [Puniceicoccales bacterium]